MTARLPDEWRSLFAECRAIEAGHNARFDVDRSVFLVKSDSEPGVDREVTVQGVVWSARSVALSFSCSCPAGRRGQGIGYGRTACKHAAAVARRLAREGLAKWRPADTRWIAVGRLRVAALDAAGDFSTDPPCTLDAPGHRARVATVTDSDRLAAMIRAGLE